MRKHQRVFYFSAEWIFIEMVGDGRCRLRSVNKNIDDIFAEAKSVRPMEMWNGR